MKVLCLKTSQGALSQNPRRQHFLPPNPPSWYPLVDTVYSTDRYGSHSVPLPKGWGNDSEQGLTSPVIYSLLRAMNKNYNGQRKVLFRKMAVQEHPRTSKGRRSKMALLSGWSESPL